MSNQKNLDEILKKAVGEMGWDMFPQEQQEQLMIQMTEALLRRMTLEVMERLKEEDREEYQKMLESNAEPEKVQSFLESKIENLSQIMDGVIVKFKEEVKRGIS